MKTRNKAAVATAAMITATLLASGANASALEVTLITGLNSPQGTNQVAAPAAATGGVINAFTKVTYGAAGDLSNIDVVIAP
jgi:hypothetical protein